MDILNNITINLPSFSDSFKEQFLSFLTPFGQIEKDSITFQNTLANSLPVSQFKFTDADHASILFETNEEQISVKLENTSGVVKISPHSYSPITIEEFVNRIKNVEMAYLDHIGFNLPWMKGAHPEIAKLRDTLKDKSLYHLFPSGEDWDFIIPGTSDEISGSKAVDYTLQRKPKFELVSIDKTSTPLIQIDLNFNAPYTKLAELFPEGILMMDYKYVWVYIKHQYNFDLCFVLNEKTNEDWSEFFKDTRLT